MPPAFREMTIRHYSFMIGGLKEVAKELKQLNINFHLLSGFPPSCLPKLVVSLDVGLLVTDFCPLRESRSWTNALQKSVTKGKTQVAVHQVDAHNVVPVWVTSDKEEWAAYTIRPKITKRLDEYLTPFPPVVRHPHHSKSSPSNPDFDGVLAGLKIDSEGWGVTSLNDSFSPGTQGGLSILQAFVSERLSSYGSNRNNPNTDALSDLSPWIRFGQVSMQTAALYVKSKGKRHKDGVDAFLEEGIVRRELAENFCYYNAHYDSIKGAADWARKTLDDHRKDPREYVYTRQQLEKGRTHDDLWNAAQLQLVQEGKMHGFLRMYWAKKVLEWTNNPETALREVLRLNDRFSLDGNSPGGFVGAMWSVAGVHDRAWTERPVFGKIRFSHSATAHRQPSQMNIFPCF